MKRTGIFLAAAVLAVALVLTGCWRSPSTSQRAQQDTSDSSQDTSTSTDTASPALTTPDHTSGFRPSTHALVDGSEVPLLEQIDRENTRVVAAVAPCLVRITALMQVDPHAQLLDLPFRFPGLPHGVRTVIPSYGSGVIISRDGYIVTNFHVVREARGVEVELGDQRTFAAHLLPPDPDSDIAVLKIDATGLPAIPWGNSDKVQVGQQVFALGNPFNLDTSVSKGIVSGIGRNLPDAETSNEGDIHPQYEDYIQTDAAINVGNSGGALVDIHGRLVGINAAIASFTQGSEGVGFSIPSNLVRATVEQLINNGHLTRGYLGVRLPVRVDDGVPEQLGLDSNRGALLAGIQRSSPAEQARLRPVDCIVALDGHRIDSLPQFRLIVSQIPIGKQVEVSYVRAGVTRSTTVKIGELPKDIEPDDVPVQPTDMTPPPVTLTSQPVVNNVLAGINVTDLTAKSRELFGVDDFISDGVVVTSVQDGSAADQKGLMRGDVIEVACAQRGEIKTLSTAGDYAGLAKGIKVDQPVVLLVHHGKLSGAEDRSSTFLYLAPDQR
jgi:serine protease Do